MIVIETLGVRRDSPQHIKRYFGPTTTIYKAVQYCGELVKRFYDDPAAPTSYRIEDAHGKVLELKPDQVRSFLFLYDTEEKFKASVWP